MKKILLLFFLATIFAVAPLETLAQKIRKPKAKTDPTLRPSKKSTKKKVKFMKKKKRRSAIDRKTSFYAFYWRKESGQQL